MRRIVIATVLTLLLLGTLGSSLASAAPKNGEVFTLDCEGQTLVVVVPPPDADWTPGIIIEGGQGVLVPVAIEFTVTDASGEILAQESVAKRGAMVGLQDELITCTLTETFEEGGELITFALSATVHVAPRR